MQLNKIQKRNCIKTSMKNSTNFRNLLSRYVLEGLSFIEASLPSKPKSRSGRNFIKFPAPYTTNLSCSSCKQKKKKKYNVSRAQKIRSPRRTGLALSIFALEPRGSELIALFFLVKRNESPEGVKIRGKLRTAGIFRPPR